MKRALLACFLCCLVVEAFAERQMLYKYVVFFKEKDPNVYLKCPPSDFLSQQSLSRRKLLGITLDERDFPVSSKFLDTLRSAGYTVHSVSRWLNCAIVVSDKKNEEQRLRLIYGVKHAELVGYGYKRTKNKVIDSTNITSKRVADSQSVYGKSEWQIDGIGANKLHQQGLLGKGVTIAVIDAGFKHANRIGVFKDAMHQVSTAYDFVDLEYNVFDDDEHGTSVWSCLAANDSFVLIGSAPQASYLLLRSEDAATEFPVEEFFWVVAAEFADSAGADIISSSLGYTDFDDDRFNHTHKEIFEQKAWISKGAKIAAEKGMLVINSSGNEGGNDWRTVAFPADVEEVITVGAVDVDGFIADFSSIGVKGGKHLKPNVVAPGKGVYVASSEGNVHAANGTSYACPILAGGLACLWPLLKTLSQKQIKELLQLSSNYYHQPDIYSGYGVPDLQLLYHFTRNMYSDTIFDIRKLKDKNWHIAGNVIAPTTVELQLLNVNEELLSSQYVSIDKAGGFRIVLSKTTQLKSGAYQLRYIIQQKKYTLPFQISLHENN